VRATTSRLQLAQDGSVRFAALAEKSADVAAKRLDTHFIDQFSEPPDI
jgi:hypothetical protein